MKKTNKSLSKMKRQDAVIAETAIKAAQWDAEAALHERDKGPFHALQHRGVERVDENVDGVARTVTRTINTLRQMALDGDISIEQHQMAVDYKHWFDRAGLDPIKAAPMDGMPRGGGQVRTPYDSGTVEDARDRLASYHDALGGVSDPMARAMYWSVGMGCNFGGRKVSGKKRTARKQNLINALERLVWINQGCRKKKH